MTSQGVRFRRRGRRPGCRAAGTDTGRLPPCLAGHAGGIGTEHILLALLELEDGGGVLTGLGIDKAGAAEHVTATLAGLGSVKPA
jgi:ClpA/ClpB-like protein